MNTNYKYRLGYLDAKAAISIPGAIKKEGQV